MSLLLRSIPGFTVAKWARCGNQDCSDDSPRHRHDVRLAIDAQGEFSRSCLHLKVRRVRRPMVSTVDVDHDGKVCWHRGLAAPDRIRPYGFEQVGVFETGA